MIGRYFHEIVTRCLIGTDIDAAFSAWRLVCRDEYGEEQWW
jgi:hypothetical protein